MPDDCFLLIKASTFKPIFPRTSCAYFFVIALQLDVERIRLLKLEVNADSIRGSLLSSRLKIKPKDCRVLGESMITVNPGVSGKTTMYYALQFLKEKITSVVVKGLPTVSRAPGRA